jgi:hypothetical protein
VSVVEVSMLSTLVLLALTAIALIATRRSFWLFGLSRMRWVSGKVSIAGKLRDEQPKIAIGVRESYVYRSKTWHLETSRRIQPDVVFTPEGSEPTELSPSGARWLFPARRSSSGSEMRVERIVRDGDAVTLVSSGDAGPGPVAIFAGEMRAAKGRHRAELARVVLPFLMIVIAAAYLVRVELGLPSVDPATLSQP